MKNSFYAQFFFTAVETFDGVKVEREKKTKMAAKKLSVVRRPEVNQPSSASGQSVSHDALG